MDPDGYPAIAPPWGTLNAINLNTGEYAWKIPLGEYPELAEKGMKDTGTENYGGPIVTAGGLVFIGATNFDKKLRAFDKTTGKLLWETTLPFAGNATPATYEVGGRQFVVIAAGGGKIAGGVGRDVCGVRAEGVGKRKVLIQRALRFTEEMQGLLFLAADALAEQSRRSRLRGLYRIRRRGWLSC